MGFLAPMPALDSLLGSLRGCLDRFSDKRRGMNATYSIGDIGMAAFSVFFMQSPSFLAHQRQLEEGHGRSNCASPFGIAKIPSDNHIRDMLDPPAPALLRPVFAETIEQLRQIDGGLDMFRRLDGRVLIALNGSEYHCSRKIDCRHCATRVRGNGGGSISTACWRPRWWHRGMVTNWPEYDAALVRRGSLTVWFTEEAVAAWHAPATRERGG